MITFIIHGNGLEKTFTCNTNDSILSLKDDIIKEFELKCDYIDLDFQLERPIRELGKFNLESGVIPRTLDTYNFDRYGLDNKTINAEYIEVADYTPKKYNKIIRHVNLSQKYKRENKIEEQIFNINSEEDFPSL
jgi:hypothetical protein